MMKKEKETKKVEELVKDYERKSMIEKERSLNSQRKRKKKIIELEDKRKLSREERRFDSPIKKVEERNIILRKKENSIKKTNSRPGKKQTFTDQNQRTIWDLWKERETERLPEGTQKEISLRCNQRKE